MPLSRACATGLRTKLACRRPGSAMSSTKRPRPRSRTSSSTRSKGRRSDVFLVFSLIVRQSQSLPLHLLHDRVPSGELFAQVAVAALGAVAENRLEAGGDKLVQERLVGP